MKRTEKPVPILFILLLSLTAALPLAWNQKADNLATDLLFKLRGERTLDDRIALVYLGDEDISALGGWPVTRDFYAYIIHALNSLNARVIAFDLLLDQPNTQYPEFDARLSDFLESSNNVCLAYSLSISAQDSSQIQTGADNLKVILPAETFRRHAAGLGFTNLTEETVARTQPIFFENTDSVYFSFAAEIIRIFSRESSEFAANSTQGFPSETLRLNHFGSLEQVQKFSFIDVLRRFESSPDSLDFTGKIVIVAATSAAFPILKETPFSPTLPSALIHATAIDNLLNGSFIKSPSTFFYVFALLAFGTLLLGLVRIKKSSRRYGFLLGALSLWFVAALFLFSFFNFLLPIFHPALMTFGLLTLSLGTQYKTRLSSARSESARLSQQAQDSEDALAAKEKALKHAQNESQALAAQTQKLAHEKAQTMELLVKERRDQKAVNPTQPSESANAFGIIHSPASKMRNVLELVKKVARDDLPILLFGETGTGKEMVANAIHQSSERRNNPFVAVNCGALSETLLESEIFGHEKGSFTGAHSQRRGRFELADKGVIFLDEIAETTPAFQAKLLRVLQEGSFERLGGERTLQVDVRVICASNVNLRKEVENNRFRADLFYRLNGLTIDLPPLRERTEDISLLASFFLEKYNYAEHVKFSERAFGRLLEYQWPGNVRELENTVRRAAVLAEGDGRNLIQMVDLPDEIQTDSSKANVDSSLANTNATTNYASLEEQVLTCLREARFSRSAISQTARTLGNRDRGTVTEYFRGIVFKTIVEQDFDFQKAKVAIAGTDDNEIVERVRRKMEDYLKNVYSEKKSPSNLETKNHRLFKGLPSTYHPFLLKILEHFHYSSNT